MRKTPDVAGEKVATLPRGEVVKVLQTNQDKVEIDGELGSWVKVAWKNQEGWMFGRYLSEKPVSGMKELFDGFLSTTFDRPSQYWPTDYSLRCAADGTCKLDGPSSKNGAGGGDPRPWYTDCRWVGNGPFVISCTEMSWSEREDGGESEKVSRPATFVVIVREDGTLELDEREHRWCSDREEKLVFPPACWSAVSSNWDKYQSSNLLNLAIAQERVEVVEFLLAHGFSVDSGDGCAF